MKNKLYVLFKTAIVIAVIAIPLLFAKQVGLGVQKGIDISLRLAIPSLFFFMVVSDILCKSGLVNLIVAPFSKLFGWIFKIDKRLIGVVFLSVIGGYPVGARLISDYVYTKNLDRKTGELMLCYCVNCGPAFTISCIGIAAFNNIYMGVLIFISQVIASFFIGYFTSFFVKDHSFNMPKNRSTSFDVLVVSCVKNTTVAMIMICSFIVLFSGFTTFLEQIGVYNLLQNFNLSPDAFTTIATAIDGLLEVTKGCHGLAAVPFIPRLISACIFTAFGGVCVHLQILSLVKKSNLSLKWFYLTRPLYIAISVAITYLCYQFVPNVQSVFNPDAIIVPKIYTQSAISSFFLIILCVGFLLSFKKSVTIE